MSILNTQYTLPFKKEDISNEMARIIVNSNLLIGKLQARAFMEGSTVNMLNPASGNATGGTPETHEFNWLEEKLVPKIATITNGAGTGNTINVADSSIFEVFEVLKLSTADNKNIPEKVLITAIPDATTLTVERDFGFGGVGQDPKSPATLVAGNKVILSHSLRGESNKDGIQAGKYTLPVKKTNYIELFKTAAEISKSSITEAVYGINDPQGQVILNSFRQRYIEFIRGIDSALITGLKNKTDLGVDGDSYQTGGILEFVEGRGRSTASNILDKSNTDITEGDFTDMFRYLGSAGCQTKDFAIVCNRIQSSKISQFATSGTNPIVYKNYQGMGLEQGQSVAKINSNIADGTSGQIIISESVDEDKIYILDMSKIKVRPKEYNSWEETTANRGGEVRTWTLRSRLGFEIRNGDTCHAVIKNLSV
jgi:hypothetical protein